MHKTAGRLFNVIKTSLMAVCIACLCTFSTHAIECDVGYFGYNDECIQDQFQISTIDMPANTTFRFEISAKGTFWVDWGDGDIQKIIRTNVTNTPVTHEYTNGGAYTIHMGGNATGYSTAGTIATISFKSNTNIAEINGSLGAIFKTIINTSDNVVSQPRFFQTFSGCSNLGGKIPENLFVGISGAPVSYMFYNMFYNCSNLTGNIPEKLFVDIKGSPMSYMFYGTFYNCSNLSGNIPEKLFAGINGTPAEQMFTNTFYGCTKLTSDQNDPNKYAIPEKLFAKIKGPPAKRMFESTFSGCKGLAGSFPEKLFAGISGAPAPSMFYSTFKGCNGLTGFVPVNLFKDISTDTIETNQMTNIFYGTGLATKCPAEYTESDTAWYNAFKSNYSGKVACQANNPTCPENSTFSDTANACVCDILGYSMNDDATMCVANKITIHWDGAESSVVTYDGDIVTPVAAKQIPGKRFRGWKFQKQQE